MEIFRCELCRFVECYHKGVVAGEGDLRDGSVRCVKVCENLFEVFLRERWRVLVRFDSGSFV